MNISSHNDATFTWIFHEQLKGIWYICGMNYSWTILANGAHEIIMNCPWPFNVHGYFLNSSWALLWTVHKIFMNTVHEQFRIFQLKLTSVSQGIWLSWEQVFSEYKIIIKNGMWTGTFNVTSNEHLCIMYNVTKFVTFIKEAPYLHNCYPHLARNWNIWNKKKRV